VLFPAWGKAVGDSNVSQQKATASASHNDAVMRNIGRYDRIDTPRFDIQRSDKSSRRIHRESATERIVRPMLS
jgi:hypothetical protein